MSGARTPLRDAHVLAPHFKRRLSGVTTTVINLAPLQAAMMRERGRNLVTVGPGLPDGMPRAGGVPGLRWLSLLRRPRGAPRRVWHARRNVEMLPAIVLRDVLRAPLAVMFTSDAQRRHTGYTRWLLRRMDRVVAGCEGARRFLSVPASVVMHGVDTERFRPAADRDALRRSLGLDLEARYVGCFGRVRENKGVGDFVDAAIRLLPERPGWTAVIGGRTTAEHAGFERALRERIASAGLDERIRFLGEVPGRAPFEALDLYVAPQHVEGYGLTPLEAMACGVPVVATRAGAFTEMVTPRTGRVVPCRDVDALAVAMAALMDDDALRERMARAARAHVEASFPLEGEAAALCAIYDELLGDEPIDRRGREPG